MRVNLSPAFYIHDDNLIFRDSKGRGKSQKDHEGSSKERRQRCVHHLGKGNLAFKKSNIKDSHIKGSHQLYIHADEKSVRYVLKQLVFKMIVII